MHSDFVRKMEDVFNTLVSVMASRESNQRIPREVSCSPSLSSVTKEQKYPIVTRKIKKRLNHLPALQLEKLYLNLSKNYQSLTLLESINLSSLHLKI